MLRSYVKDAPKPEIKKKATRKKNSSKAKVENSEDDENEEKNIGLSETDSNTILGLDLKSYEFEYFAYASLSLPQFIKWCEVDVKKPVNNNHRKLDLRRYFEAEYLKYLSSNMNKDKK